MQAALSIDIPQGVVDALRLPPDEAEGELARELALALYRRGILPGGKAAVLARMTRREFEALVARRRIVRHYGTRDLKEDVEYASGNQ